MTPREVYHAPTDMFVRLVSADSKCRATIDHPALGRIIVPCGTLREVTR